jgi:hypothetical protein
MAGMETVVRPVVFPDIRPAPARPLPALEDPDQGKCEIVGAGSFMVSFSNSTSWSVTYGKSKEIKRRVDEARVYQKDNDGTINKDNFVDIEVANKIWMKGPTLPVTRDVTEDDQDKSITRPEIREYDYAPAEETDNVEITKRNKIKTREESK